jgi:hypothetical protein
MSGNQKRKKQVRKKKSHVWYIEIRESLSSFRASTESTRQEMQVSLEGKTEARPCRTSTL